MQKDLGKAQNNAVHFQIRFPHTLYTLFRQQHEFFTSKLTPWEKSEKMLHKERNERKNYTFA